MKMKEVCEKTLLTERTVRFYMEKGLVSPKTEWINGRNYSDFSREDVEMLKAVKILREITFSVDEILAMQQEPALIADMLKEKCEAAKKEHQQAENTFSVLNMIDAEGIDSMMMLAERAKKAALDRPYNIAPIRPQEINQSGMGDRCETMPASAMGRWNWGAFLFPVIWGLANHVYQALLCMIPVFGLFYAFYLGRNGNELAWRGRYWESEQIFKKTQRIWAIVAAIIAIAQVALGIGVAVSTAAEEKKHEDKMVSLAEQLKNSGEFRSVVQDRIEWEDGITGDHMPRVDQTEDAEGIEAAIEKCVAELVYTIGDPFYEYEDKYYRVLLSDGFDIGIQSADPFGSTDMEYDGMYTALVELSNGKAWSFSCDVSADRLYNITIGPMEDFDEDRIQPELLEEAAEHLADYLNRRYDEVISSEEWQETVGEDFTVTNIAPQHFETSALYDGQMPKLMGIIIEAKAPDGEEYIAAIDTEYDEKTDTDRERELYVITK